VSAGRPERAPGPAAGARHPAAARRPGGHERRRLRTRARLFEAALAEFRRVGVEASSVARIARRAGVSRPSFYFHFPTKSHVLLELQWRLEQEILARLEPCATPGEALHRFVDELVEVEARVGRGDLFRDLLRVWVRPPEAVDLEAVALPVVEAIQARFRDARDRAELRGGLDPDRAALLFLASVFGYLIGVGGEGPQAREDLRALVALYRADPEPQAAQAPPTGP
jgi:TetR/AcrR family transcriptional repressor of uid operon